MELDAQILPRFHIKFPEIHVIVEIARNRLHEIAQCRLDLDLLVYISTWKGWLVMILPARKESCIRESQVITSVVNTGIYNYYVQTLPCNKFTTSCDISDFVRTFSLSTVPVFPSDCNDRGLLILHGQL